MFILDVRKLFLSGGWDHNDIVFPVLFFLELDVFLPGRFSEVRMPSEHNLGQDDAQSIYIYLVINLSPFQLLDRLIKWSTSLGHCFTLVLAQTYRSPKISNFEHTIFDENVVGFQVVVDDLVAVQQSVAVDKIFSDSEKFC